MDGRGEARVVMLELCGDSNFLMSMSYCGAGKYQAVPRYPLLDMPSALPNDPSRVMIPPVHYVVQHHITTSS